jgi:hypothetical protein
LIPAANHDESLNVWPTLQVEFVVDLLQGYITGVERALKRVALSNLPLYLDSRSCERCHATRCPAEHNDRTVFMKQPQFLSMHGNDDLRVSTPPAAAASAHRIGLVAIRRCAAS